MIGNWLRNALYYDSNTQNIKDLYLAGLLEQILFFITCFFIVFLSFKFFQLMFLRNKLNTNHENIEQKISKNNKKRNIYFVSIISLTMIAYSFLVVVCGCADVNCVCSRSDLVSWMYFDGYFNLK